ncbi:hypothetical protein EMCRGX_G019123 [Ephydatia muelleri]
MLGICVDRQRIFDMQSTQTGHSFRLDIGEVVVAAARGEAGEVVVGALVSVQVVGLVLVAAGAALLLLLVAAGAALLLLLVAAGADLLLLLVAAALLLLAVGTVLLLR